MATKTNTWSANSTQNAFMDALKGTTGLTLHEVNQKLNREIKTGSINTLITKGLVSTTEATFECDIVKKGTTDIVGSCKKTVKVYHLKEEDPDGTDNEEVEVEE